MSVATEIERLIAVKAAIRAGIEAKGVPVAVGLMLTDYAAKIGLISTGSTGWAKPAEWIDISSVANNEINLLATDGNGIAFAVRTASGNYSIDWGDGTIETERTSTTTYQHQYNGTGGTWCPTLGYMVYKVRIYGATGNITRFQMKRHTYTLNNQYQMILWAVFGTVSITDYSYTFSDTSLYLANLVACTIPSFVSCTTTISMFNGCSSLVSVDLPASWGSVINAYSMFMGCTALISITIPSSWGNIINIYNIFSGCSAIISITIPSSWGSVNNVSGMFNGCIRLVTIILPASCGSITDMSNMLNGCSSLISITMPTSWDNVQYTIGMIRNCTALISITLPAGFGKITDATKMIYFCTSLKTITNINYLGSIISQCIMTDVISNCEMLLQNISIGSRLSSFGAYGFSGIGIKLNSLRLTNTGSTFTGSSPHVNVSYTSMDAAALNLLFGDLPTLVGKTINITGCLGAATCTRSIATAKGWTITG